MPASTANLKPVIIYLPEEDCRKLEQLAKEQQRSVSQMGRYLLAKLLHGDA